MSVSYLFVQWFLWDKPCVRGLSWPSYDQTRETSDTILVCLSIVQYCLKSSCWTGGNDWSVPIMGLKFVHREVPTNAAARCALHAQKCQDVCESVQTDQNGRTGVAMVCDPLWVWRVGLAPGGGRGCCPPFTVLLLSVDKLEAAAGQPAAARGPATSPPPGGAQTTSTLLPACHR